MNQWKPRALVVVCAALLAWGAFATIQWRRAEDRAEAAARASGLGTKCGPPETADEAMARSRRDLAIAIAITLDGGLDGNKLFRGDYPPYYGERELTPGAKP